MNQYDFLILFDGKQRELESICLLRVELERRGYRVKIFPQSTWHYLTHRIPPYDCEVLVTPWAYNDGAVAFALRYVRRFKKIVNLQWEQFWDLADDKNPSHFGFISGRARECVHLCWGPKNAEKLEKRCGIPPRNLIKAGQPSFDFLRGEFQPFYEDKQILFQRYGIPQDHTTLLFISGFYFSSVPETVVPAPDAYTTVDKSLVAQTAARVKDLTLRLFDELLTRRDDVTIIYRLHPVEWGCDKVRGMEKKHGNFRLISELSVKQWIKAVDKVYTWQSTAAAEAILAGKPCYNIGVNDIPQNMRSPLLEHSAYIDNYSDFQRSILRDDFPCTVDKAAMQERYGYTTPDVPTYIKLCDGLENVYRDESYTLAPDFAASMRGIKSKRDALRIKFKKSRLYDGVFYLAQHTSLNWKALQRIRSQIKPFQTPYYEEIQNRFAVAPGEIDAICAKIAALFTKGNKPPSQTGGKNETNQPLERSSL